MNVEDQKESTATVYLNNALLLIEEGWLIEDAMQFLDELMSAVREEYGD